MSWRIGVDIGGTFTDFALLDDAGKKLSIHKQLTTPADPSAAVIEGIKDILRANGVSISAVDAIAHGTTLVTNAVIERRGAVTGMLVTDGFGDIMDMGMEQRYDLFDLRIRYPDPIVPRTLRRGVAERIHFDGRVETPVNLSAARAAICDLVRCESIEALAICFLHSYIDPAHERAVGELARMEFPDLYVSTSADVYPNMREYERWTTTAINAYARPMADRYLERLEGGLAALGFRGRLDIMTSSGGMLAPDTARRFPVRLLESGPAAGMLMASVQGRTLNLPNVLSFDLGGTTAKGALVRNFAPLKTEQIEVARVHESRRGSGLPLRIPVLDMIEIGSGGGSIAAGDDRGLLEVGPRSAGADPGPACYGKDGRDAALSDANLLLGYLDPNFFLGGKMMLDLAAAEEAIRTTVAEPLALSIERAAWGIHDTANEDIARAFRIHAAERGFDYRAASMVAFGGSGPLHAMPVAEKLKIPRVVFPIGAGVYSALGLLASPLAFELARSRRTVIDDIDAKMFAEMFEPLVDEASGFLEEAGIASKDIRIHRQIDIRYFGQTHEIQVSLPEGDPRTAFANLRDLFERRYAEVYTFATLEAPLEIINWKVSASGPDPKFETGYALETDKNPSSKGTLKGLRQVYFAPDGYRETPVYDRYSLRPGTSIDGPALIEERESTCLLTPGSHAQVDEQHNIVAELEEIA
ncbi:MAG: Acetophenone carboxylase gamma subunit [Alphaproteobacteria bacterium MarineAlpha4_Bin2]|nr:MAG: Acetophenone carboxylase gamma subunit [Alphaproteobacteria bacterium MarineAlpha4_Bin2]